MVIAMDIPSNHNTFVSSSIVASIQRILPVACLIVLALILFVPFGTRNLPLVEEWMLIEGGNQDGGLFYTPVGHESRPLQSSLYYIAYLLDPVGFTGFPLMLAALFLLKGIVIWGLMRRLVPQYRELAFLTAVLYLVMPADQGVFITRPINIHGASLLYFVALYCLLTAVNAKTRLLPVVFGMMVALAASLLMYDAGYPLALLSPAILLIAPRGTPARGRFVVVAWTSVVFLCVLFKWILVAGSAAAYQQMVFDSPTVLNALYPVALSIVRHFMVGWLEAIPLLPSSFAYLVLAGISGVGAIWVLSTLFPARIPAYRLAVQRLLPLFMLGVAILVLGVAAHIVSIYRYSDWRMYYYASLGGAMSVAVAVMLVRSRYGQRFALIVTGALIVLGVVHALHQQAAFVEDSDAARALLNDTRSQLASVAPGTTIVYLNYPPGGTLHRDMFYHHGYLVSALRVVNPGYQGLREAYVCRVGQCEVTASTINVRLNASDTVYLLRQNVRLFDYSPSEGYVLQTSKAF